MYEKLIKQLIDSFYSITVHRIHKMSNSLFLITTKESSSVQYLFKIHLLFDLSQMDQINSIFQLVAEKHFSPLIIPDKKGLYISFYYNYAFSLQIFMEGNSISLENKDLFAKRLAELHKFLNTCSDISVNNHFDRTVTDMNQYALFYGYEKLIPILDKVMTIKKNTPEQLIHGDLHANNIICCNNNIFFIDFDSMTFFLTIADVAFAGFRCYGMNKKRLYEFIHTYNQYNPPCPVNKAYIWHFLVYIILQRILFIHIENDKGNQLWITDLENQKNYLSIVLRQLNYE